MEKNQNFYETYGFVNDNNKELLSKIFNNEKVKEVHIDTYIDEPYILFSRVIEKNVSMNKKDNRITIRKNDRNKTMIVNIFFDEIKDCAIKQYSNNQYELLFNVRNICYKMLVII